MERAGVYRDLGKVDGIINYSLQYGLFTFSISISKHSDVIVVQ
jgi:hypothetical protein